MSSWRPSVILSASRTVLNAGRGYRAWFLPLALLIYAAYVLLPVWLIPGNSLRFQLQLFRAQDHVLFVALGLATALLVLMQVFLFRRTRGTARITAVGRGGVGVWSAVFGGLLATAACSSCIAAFLGFLGAGSTLFIVRHRTPVVLVAFAVVLTALLTTARRVQGYCEECEGLPERPKP